MRQLTTCFQKFQETGLEYTQNLGQINRKLVFYLLKYSYRNIYEYAKVIRNKEQHLCQELERNNIHFGKGIDLYDANIKIASVLNEEDLRKVLKVMSENEIIVASSEILTYAELQKHNPGCRWNKTDVS